jgi:hypothetical protein
MLLFVDCPKNRGASLLKTNGNGKTAGLGEKKPARLVQDVANPAKA